MAEATTKAAPKANQTPAPKAPETPKAPEAVTAPVEPKKPRVSETVIHKTAEEATNDAASRDKGPRRAFTATFQGKQIHVMGANQYNAAHAVFCSLGGTIDEIGKAPRAAKTVSPDTILSQVNALPEADRAKVLEQLKSLIK